MKQIKIILADDHRIFRDGIKSLLFDTCFITIIGEASDGKELLEIEWLWQSKLGSPTQLVKSSRRFLLRFSQQVVEVAGRPSEFGPVREMLF